jgi:hypothetical protein
MIINYLYNLNYFSHTTLDKVRIQIRLIPHVISPQLL